MKPSCTNIGHPASTDRYPQYSRNWPTTEKLHFTYKYTAGDSTSVAYIQIHIQRMNFLCF